jgi:hypothetical protein
MKAGINRGAKTREQQRESFLIERKTAWNDKIRFINIQAPAARDEVFEGLA